MKLLIFGASGSGTSTLGRELAQALGYIHLDVDDYYWRKTDPPFQEKVPFEERNENLSRDFYAADQVIISGSMVSWGKAWERAFDLAIFLYLAPEIRIDRLQKREMERYGHKLEVDQQVKAHSQAFIEWARKYEDPTFRGRSLSIHKEWIELLSCPVLTLSGNLTVAYKVEKVLNQMENLTKKG